MSHTPFFTLAHGPSVDFLPQQREARDDMICPACGGQLTALGVEGLVIDACRGGCGGLWFDNFELHKVDDWHERLGDPLLAIEVNPQAVIVPDRRPCPKCVGVV